MRISILTPTIDTAAYIDEAVGGLLRVSAAEIEHIVIHDGGPEYAAALARKYPHLKILRGPGQGPTPAIAMGIAAASGEFIGYVSSDDRLVGATIDLICRAMHQRPEIKIWTGGARMFRQDAHGHEATTRLLTSPELTAASLGNVLDDLPLVNARFFHRSVYVELGNLDLRFPESSDREFMIRVALSGIAEASIDAIVSEQRQHERSRTMHRVAGIVPPYLSEHLRIADMWLGRPALPDASRRLFRRWRAREVLRLAAAQARAGRLDQAFATITNETIRDPLLPIWAPSSLAAWRRRRRTDTTVPSQEPVGSGGSSTLTIDSTSRATVRPSRRR